MDPDASGVSFIVMGSTITDNRAEDGEGSDGQGIGGGVYHLGAFSFDVTTVIRKNHDSTSNDSIGP
jgi:hypothetical protein